MRSKQGFEEGGNHRKDTAIQRERKKQQRSMGEMVKVWGILRELEKKLGDWKLKAWGYGGGLRLTNGGKATQSAEVTHRKKGHNKITGQMGKILRGKGLSNESPKGVVGTKGEGEGRKQRTW